MGQCCFSYAVYGIVLGSELVGADLFDRIAERLSTSDTDEISHDDLTGDDLFAEISEAIGASIPTQAVLLTTGCDHPAECQVPEGEIVLGIGLLREPWQDPIEVSEAFRSLAEILTWAQVG